MRITLKIVILALVGWMILLALTAEGDAQYITLPYGERAVNHPTNVVFVDAGGNGYTTIKAGAAACANGGTVFIWPGTYADSNLAITGKRLDFVALGPLKAVLWQAGDTLAFLSNADDSCTFQGIYFKGTGSGNLLPAAAKDWWAFNCTFDCSLFVPVTSADVTMRNCMFYPRKMDAWTIGGTGYWWTESCQLGEPLAVSDHGISYNLYITQGTLSIRGGHFYSDSTIIKVSGTGSAQAYEGAEFFLRTSSGADTGICAIQVTGGNFNAYGGCKIKNAAPDSATIQVWGTATVALDASWVENKGGGFAYRSNSTGIGSLHNNSFSGPLWLGAADKDDLPVLRWTEADVAVNDAWPLLWNSTGDSLFIIQIEVQTGTQFDTSRFMEYTNIGGAASGLIDSAIVSNTGTNCFYMAPRKYGDISGLAAAGVVNNGNTLWYEHRDQSGTAAWVSVWIKYSLSP